MASYGGSISPEESKNSFFSYEGEEGNNVSAKSDVRQKLSADVEAFLKLGGEIKHVSMGVTSDPPKRPESNYGRRPI
ncbi:MAG: hypothetical protein KUG83_02105 [Gammaproteobacteria bacterium]|nr:hypothetical protein [Gammaproteobacteria bacterium]